MQEKDDKRLKYSIIWKVGWKYIFKFANHENIIVFIITCSFEELLIFNTIGVGKNQKTDLLKCLIASAELFDGKKKSKLC